MFSNSQIHPNSTDKFYRLRQIHFLLNTVGLLTLVQGHRTRPILNQDKNKHGCRKQKVLPYKPPVVAGVDLSFTISNTKDIDLEEDDMYYYTYDVDRLYSLLDTIFHKDCRHYLISHYLKLIKIRQYVVNSLDGKHCLIIFHMQITKRFLVKQNLPF